MSDFPRRPAPFRGGDFKPRSQHQWQVTHKILDSISLGLNELLDEHGIAKLMRRPREISFLLAEGLTDNQISIKLEISIGTVSIYIENLANTLGVTKQSELIKLVQAHQYRSDES